MLTEHQQEAVSASEPEGWGQGNNPTPVRLEAVLATFSLDYGLHGTVGSRMQKGDGSPGIGG